MQIQQLQQLSYVVAVARTGNFARGAEECHVSQPSLSPQIKKLKDELGEKLFHRMKREVKLTPQGQLLLERAERILAEVEAAKREASEARALERINQYCSHGPAGPISYEIRYNQVAKLVKASIKRLRLFPNRLARGLIRVGVLPTIAPYLLPQALSRSSGGFPGIEIVVQEDTTAQLLALLAAHEVDLAIASTPIQDERMHTETLFTEELLVALQPKHPLLKKKSIRLADLESERFILMKAGHCLGDQVLNFCSRRNFRPRVLYRSAQDETIRALVQVGMGILLIHAMACRVSHSPAPHDRSLPAPKPHRKIVAL